MKHVPSLRHSFFEESFRKLLTDPTNLCEHLQGGTEPELSQMDIGKEDDCNPSIWAKAFDICLVCLVCLKVKKSRYDNSEGFFLGVVNKGLTRDSWPKNVMSGGDC